MQQKIYTKTGDKGETGLYGGSRIGKDSLRIEAIGSIDELNAILGEVLSIKYQVSSIKKELINIQNDLYEIGALLATPKDTHIKKGKEIQKNFPAFLKQRTDELEIYIDTLTLELPALTAFILPGGGSLGATLHHARTVCRRVERRVVTLTKKEFIPPEILIYLNRLSDTFFTMARFANYKDKHKEILWNKRGSL